MQNMTKVVRWFAFFMVVIVFSGCCSQELEYSYGPVKYSGGQVMAKDFRPPVLYIRTDYTTFVVNQQGKWEQLEVGEVVSVVYQPIYLKNEQQEIMTGYYFVDAKKGFVDDLLKSENAYRYLWRDGPCHAVSMD